MSPPLLTFSSRDFLKHWHHSPCKTPSSPLFDTRTTREVNPSLIFRIVLLALLWPIKEIEDFLSPFQRLKESCQDMRSIFASEATFLHLSVTFRTKVYFRFWDKSGKEIRGIISNNKRQSRHFVNARRVVGEVSRTRLGINSIEVTTDASGLVINVSSLFWDSDNSQLFLWRPVQVSSESV